MIRTLFLIRDPRVDMDMLHSRLFPLGHSPAHIYMVQCLAVLLVQIRISLHGRGTDYIVKIDQAGFRGEECQRFCEGEFVEVT